MSQVYQIPGKLKTEWNSTVRAMIDTWSNYGASLEEFKEAVLVKGVSHAKANRGQAWIVDSSGAVGAFSQEIQRFIGSDVFPAFAKNGIKYFITVTSQSAITRMSIAGYKAKAGPNGLQLVETASAADAVAWLAANAK